MRKSVFITEIADGNHRQRDSTTFKSFQPSCNVGIPATLPEEDQKL